jgi:hypothetical protein
MYPRLTQFETRRTVVFARRRWPRLNLRIPTAALAFA